MTVVIVEFFMEQGTLSKNIEWKFEWIRSRQGKKSQWTTFHSRDKKMEEKRYREEEKERERERATERKQKKKEEKREWEQAT